MTPKAFNRINFLKLCFIKKCICLFFALFAMIAVAQEGYADLVAAIDDGGNIYVVDSNKDGSFQNYRNVAVITGNTRGITLGDFDEDGDLDIIIGHYASSVINLVPFLNDGTGVFVQSDTIDTMRASGSTNEDMTSGDFNNDTHLDFIASGDSGKVMVYLGDGKGKFSRAAFINTEGNGRGLDAGDFNEDGNLDFVRAVYSSGNVTLYLGDGTGQFSAGVKIADAGSDPYGVVAGDFDNDGHLDLFANDGGGGNTHFYKGDGKGNFAAPVYQASLDLNSHGSFDAYDYNNDCNLDVVISNYNGRSIWFYPGNGDATFGTPVQLNMNSEGAVSLTASNALAISSPPLITLPCNPIAAFTADATTVVKGTTIQFNASGSSDDGTIVNYAWDYGDTTDVVEGAALTAPSHAFSTEGKHTVTLTVTDNTGRKDHAKRVITVTGNPPAASAGGPYAFNEADARFSQWWPLLNGTGSSDTEGILTYTWDFGGGFTENFEDKEDTGWGKEEGTWVVDDSSGTNSVYSQTNATASRTRNLFATPLPDDYRVEVDVETISGNGNEVILLFDAIDINNNFELIFRGRGTNEHDLLLYRRTNGSTSTIIEVDFPFQIPVGSYHLAAEVRGNTVTAFLDGSFIFSQTISRFKTPSRAGLCTYQTVANFDNFKVTPLLPTTSTASIHKLFTDVGTYALSLTVTDAAGQSNTDATTITITKGDPPTADAGGPYTIGEADAAAGDWYLSADPSGSTDDGLLHQFIWDFGDGTTMVSTASDASESMAAAGQIHYGYDVPNARLFFTALQNGTTIKIINLATGEVAGTLNLNQYGTTWHDGPGENIPYKIVSSKPILVNETNGSGHASFIPSRDGNGIGHEFTFYYTTSFGTYYIFAIEDTYLEIYDTSGNIISVQTLSAGTYTQLSLNSSRVYTIYAMGKIAVQTIGGNAFTAVPATVGGGVGRLFYAATDDWGKGSLAAFAHENALVSVFDMDTGEKSHEKTLVAGETWFQGSVGERRLRVESTGDIELWAGDNEGGTTLDNMGDDTTFIGGRGQKEFYFRGGTDGAALFVPYDTTSITINGETAVYKQDDYQILDPSLDYHVTSDKPVFIQILGKANNWNDFGGYLPGIVKPFHWFTPEVAPSYEPYTITVQAVDHLAQVSESAETTASLVPGDIPAARAGDDRTGNETDADDGTWTYVFTGTASTDDNGIVRYEWDFGDGVTATGMEASHTYTKTGAYTVTLTVTDAALQTHSDTLTVTITAGDPPVADAGPSSSQDEADAVDGGWTVVLDGSGSTDDVNIIRYIWDLGTDTFDSYAFNSDKWLTNGYISQYDEIALTGVGNWDSTYMFSTDTYPRVTGMFMQARVKQTGNNAMIGFKNTTDSNSYTAMPHAIYFNSSTFEIYEDGTRRTIPSARYSYNTWYDIKIELKVPSGARYYYRLSGDDDWVLLYDSDYGDYVELKRGLNVYSGTFVMDDLRDMAAGVNPTVRLYGSSDIALTVVDNAHQTHTDTTRFNVTANGKPLAGPVAAAGGPYFSRDGLPIVLDATNSSGIRPVVSYRWTTDDGRVYYGHKALVPFYKSATYYPISATASSQYTTNDWSAMQATGQPDVTACGDNRKAWTPSGKEIGEQWLELTYARAIKASGITIHETFNSGFVTRVELVDDADNPVVVWNGTDTTPCMEWLTVDINPAVTTQKVRVYIDTDIVSGWNEIDTVGLIEAQGSHVSQVTLTVTDSLGLTSTDTASITVDPTPTVVTAPWQFHGGIEIPHDTWDGKAVLLKAVAYDSFPNALTYTWDFGDGSPQETGTVSNSYAIETTHIYQGFEGTLFTARITVTDIEGNTHSDVYPIVIRGEKIDTEINVAIDDGLWWLHKNQNRNPGDYYHGRWTSYSSYYASPTASALQAFEITGHLEAGDLSEDPYVETVWNGLDFMYNGGMNAVKIGLHPLGNPDSNGNGLGIEASDGTAPYQTGMLIDAVIASSTPNEMVRKGNINIIGKKYSEIAQDMVDMYAWGMSDDKTTISALGKSDYIGGWRYNWGDWPDNSACQWAAIGLIPAEKEWSLIIPQYVKTYNDNWLWYSFTADRFGYTSTGHGNGSSIATRPSGMVQLVMNGKHDLDPPDPRWAATEGFFTDAANWQWFIEGNKTYYGWYAFTKAMRLAGTGETLTNGFNWFRGDDTAAATWGVARRLIELQEKTGTHRGRWIDGGQATHPGYYGNVLDSAWSVIMLVPDLFNLPPVANAGGNRVWGEGLEITFDGSESRHIDPSKKIVLYEWDFDGDGEYDIASVSPIVKHTYDFGGNLPVTLSVTLRVTDNGNSLEPPEAPLQDTDTITVTIVEPPHAPIAVPGGPYEITVGTPVTLDGSRSHDIDAVGGDFITLFEWDLDGDWDFDDADGLDIEGNRDEASIITFTFNHPGTYNIGLRVTDNGVFNDKKLTHTAFTTVTVTDNQPPVAVLPASYTVLEGSFLKLNGNGSYDPNKTDIGAFEWDLNGDGVFDDATGPSVDHLWSQNGIYTVSLRVTDVAVATMQDTAQSKITVLNVAPKVNAGVDIVLFGSLTIPVKGSFFDPAGDLDAPFTFLWDFGDGGSAATLEASHTYASAGTYTVTLKVTDKDGDTGSDTLRVQQVLNPVPIVTDASNNTVALNWGSYDPPAGLDHYALFQSETNFTRVNGMTPAATIAANSRAATISDLTNGTPYFFGVVSVSGTGTFNANVSTVSATPVEVDNTPPQPVTGLSAKLLSENRVGLAWTRSISPDTVSYQIYGDNGTGTMDWGTPLAMVTHPEESWISSPLTPGTTYQFGVRARDGVPNTEENTNRVSILIEYPDLIVSITNGPSAVDYGQTAHFALSVQNQGKVPVAGPVNLSVYANDTLQDTFELTQSIDAGGTLQVPANWQPSLKSQPDPYTIVWKIDSDEQVAESDETNNGTIHHQLTINRVHYLTTSADPGFALQGDRINLSASATNSDDRTVLLDDAGEDAVTVSVTLWSRGVAVAGPFALAFNTDTKAFELALDTKKLWGPFTIRFKLYDANQNVAATDQKDIVIGALDYYVDVALGSDALGDGSQLNPWKTITNSLSRIESPIATLHVASGTYSGRETFPIQMKPGVSLKGEGKTQPVISGQVDRSIILFPDSSTFTSNTTIDNMVIRNGSIGIQLQAGTSAAPRIVNASIHDNKVGIQCQGPGACSPEITDTHIFNNTLTGMAIQGLGDDRDGVSAPLITGCRFDQNGNAIRLEAGGNQNNHMRLAPVISQTFIVSNTGAGIIAQNNGGKWNSAPEIDITNTNVLIAKNKGAGIGLDGSGGLVAARITNATIADNAVGVQAQDAVPVITNTVIWGNDQAVIGVTPANVNYSDVDDPAYDGVGTNMSLEPLFQMPDTGSYNPAAGSPVVDAGTDLDAPDIDIMGMPRPMDGDNDSTAKIDIGAFEVQFHVNAGDDHTIEEGGQVDFTGFAAGGVVEGNTTYTFHWDFGDDTTAEEQTVSHVYRDDGNYLARLFVTDGQNTQAFDVATVIVENGAPKVSAPETYSCYENEPVSIKPVTFVDPGVLDTHTATITWGDGSQSEATIKEQSGAGSIMASHTYTTAGTYTVVIEVKDNAGLKGSATLPLTVNVSYETGDFNGDKAVDLRDVIIALEVATKKSPATKVYVSTDVNNDGVINIIDAEFLLQNFAGSK